MIVIVQVADLSHENFKSSRVMRWWLSRLSSRFSAKSSRERKPKWLPGLTAGTRGNGMMPIAGYEPKDMYRRTARGPVLLIIEIHAHQNSQQLNITFEIQ